MLIGSLSNDVFERRTSTGSCPFSFLRDGFAQIFSQIVSIRVKKLSNTNYIASRHITREKSSFPVDVRCSKTSLLKLPIASLTAGLNSQKVDQVCDTGYPTPLSPVSKVCEAAPISLLWAPTDSTNYRKYVSNFPSSLLAN